MTNLLRIGFCLVAALVGSGCVSRPRFVPTSGRLYSAFTPLRQPKPQVPVGALWVDGYGPVGAPASAENQVIERSLSGFTFDAGFQASLTLGLLKFLDLDPSIQNKVTAHFSDLTIMRIKDWSKLDGPTGQPRIYEALKAGTISVTASSSVGLDVENHALSQHIPVFGRGTTALARSFVIDGKDLVFAIRVARLTTITTRPITVEIDGSKRRSLAIEGYQVVVQPKVDGAKHCISGAIVELHQPVGAAQAPISAELSKNQGAPVMTELTLPVPRNDGANGLLSMLQVVWITGKARPTSCTTARVMLQVKGTRLFTVSRPSAPDW